MRRLHRIFLTFFISLMLLFANSSYANDLPIEITDNEVLSEVISQLNARNSELKANVESQNEKIKAITTQQTVITTQTSNVQHTLATLDEQEEWLSFSTALGDTLRQQLLRLPEKPKPQALDADIAEAKAQQLNYNNELSVLDDYPALSGSGFDNRLLVQYKKALREQSDLLKGLVSGCDTIIYELTKLKIANKQLTNAINEVNDAAHRYFFWVADINPITTDYPMLLLKDIMTVVSIESAHQISNAVLQLLKTPATLFLLFISICFVLVRVKIKSKYNNYLEKVSLRVGKVTQDSYQITLKVVIFSLLMALPIPILWGTVGYALQMDWEYPVAVALGYGVNAAAPILWVFMISAQFASPKGLFISHFRWPEIRVRSAMKYYQLSIWVLIPLVILVMALDYYNNRQYSATIGRFIFILLCFSLVFMTNAIHRAGVPLYIDKKGSGDNLFSHILWIMLLSAPWIAIVAAGLGYLSTAQVLLGRLEASVVVWFSLLTIYFMIRRWMWIQRRRIEFEREKQKRFERLSLRSKTDEEINLANNSESLEEPEVDLDELSDQSLHLVRSIIVMVALISMILLWSELHSAFAFMDKIKLWGTKVVVNGVEVEQSIALSSLFISILVMTITVQLVKNLPALLELGILQHLDLTPGTGYAISTISKYITLMIGCLVAFSFLGIDWSKIQWLIAALGVGLGFGLQEIFANFISGLIMLFEKPVRIGDTVTIRDLTGNITKINTRATTIVDWDRKEIVMPNKAFITEQLVNWSLSDSVTRIVLTIPATIDANSDTVVSILEDSAKKCEYVLEDPEPQVFLVDIQEGIQLYELRVFAAEMGHRMPLRSQIQQLIVLGYKEHGLTLPFPPLQTNLESMGRKSSRRIYTVGSA